jgi:putative DNA methylase
VAFGGCCIWRFESPEYDRTSVPSDLQRSVGTMAESATRAIPPLLAQIDWDKLSARVQAEQRNRECYTPPISVFRWWARRPHALIGEVLDAARADSIAGRPVVSDPFSGGGTVALEAARRGLHVYAQDLHPWPIRGLLTALDGIDADALEAAGNELMTALEPLRKELYGSRCPVHGDASEITHTFWVEEIQCPSCEGSVFLYPYGLISTGSRQRDETHGYFGCSGCGSVTRSGLAVPERRCRGCRRRLASADRRLSPKRRVTCRHCRHQFALFDPIRMGRRVVLVQRFCESADGNVLHLSYPTGADIEQAERQAGPIPESLDEPIPAGIETAVLRRAGFERWRDLYPARQIEVMLRAAEIARHRRFPTLIRRRLLLAICGASEMAGYVSRWDRYYPKAFEAIANHRYATIGLSVETNLLGPRGRGTLPRRLRASIKAARWVHQHFPEQARPALAVGARAQRRAWHGTVLTHGSSERQIPQSNVVDLVVTDPPYFDDVQYGELASLFLVWARAVRFIPKGVALDLRREAVPNTNRATTPHEYERLLTRIFKETRRTLAPEGRLILTFHNRELEAWLALGRALNAASFSIEALAVVHAENEKDHPKRTGRTFTKDLVLECRPGVATCHPTVVSVSGESQDSELVAAGLALAEVGDGESAFRRAFYARIKDSCPSDRRIIDRGRLRTKDGENDGDN